MKKLVLRDLPTWIAWEQIRHAWATEHGRRDIAADAAMRQRVLSQRFADATGVFVRRLEP